MASVPRFALASPWSDFLPCLKSHPDTKIFLPLSACIPIPKMATSRKWKHSCDWRGTARSWQLVKPEPLIIHTRSAGDDTLRILEEEHAGEVGGVFHCFTEDRDMAWRAIDLGFHVSFSGIVTFKNALDLRTVAAELPLDRLLVETDAPYLAPVPHRGKLNEPAFVRHVAEAIARLRGIAFEELAEATTRNFCRLFNVTLSDRAQDHAAA